jgi:serine/threonine-protein kinase
MTPQTIGRYRVVRRLGSGGFAAVWLAEDPWLDTRVAIKVLADIHSSDPDLRSRFVQEARLLRRIRSPHVVTVYDVGETDAGQPFFVMEEAVRGTLAARLQATRAHGTRPSGVEVGAVIDALASGLASLHAAGIVHRDIKPSNLLLQAPVQIDDAGSVVYPDETIMLGDLGLAKVLHTTMQGLTIGAGTPGYAAPEQMAPNANVDARADVFGASAVLAEILTGVEPPIGGSPDLSGIGDDMARVIARGMSPHPADRYQQIDEWAAAARNALPSTVARRHAPSPQQPGAQSNAGTGSRRASPPPSSARRPPRLRTGMLAAVLTAVVVGAAVWLFDAVTAGRGRAEAAGDTAAQRTPPTAAGAGAQTTEDDRTATPSEESPPPIGGFVSCDGGFCPSEPMCWGGLTIPAGVGREPTDIDCSKPHFWETFAADYLADDAVYLRQDELMAERPEVARACGKKALADRSRRRSKTKGWDREPWPVQIDDDTWIVHCMAGPPPGERTGSAFRAGA